MNSLTYINAYGETLEEVAENAKSALANAWGGIDYARKMGYEVDLASHNSYYVPPDRWPATGDIRVPGLYVETFVFVYSKADVYETVPPGPLDA